ncbi:MAG: oligosaccharide flippase family protein [Magnetococcus sp. DMHC-6]
MSGVQTGILDKSLRSAGRLLVLRSLFQPVTLAATILLVRVLSEEAYGVYSLFQSVLSFMGMVASLGIANTLQRFIPEYLARGEFRVAGALYRLAALIRLLVNIVLLFIVLTFWDWVAHFFDLLPYRNLFMIFSLIILLQMQKELIEICLNSYFLHAMTQWGAIVLSGIKVVGYGVGLWWHWDLLAILLVDLFGTLVVFVLLKFLARRYIPSAEGEMSGIATVDKRRFYRYALFYNFNDVGSGVMGDQFDNFFLAAYLDPLSVGVYFFCNRVAENFNKMMPTRYFKEVIKSAFFSMGSAIKTRRVGRVYQMLAKVNFFYNIIVLSFVLAVGKEMIAVVFGGNYSDHVWILVGILSFQLGIGFLKSVDIIAQLRERADIILYSKGFAVYNILADILLIPLLGIMGAVVATGTTQLLRAGYLWFFVRDCVHFRGMGKVLGLTLIYWLVVAGLVRGMGLWMVSAWVVLVMGLCMFMLAFIIFLRLNIFNRVEKRVLQNWLNQGGKMARMVGLLRLRLQ